MLIRNPAAAGDAPAEAPARASEDGRVAALVQLVRAVARRELLHGYEIEAGKPGPAVVGRTIETWRGALFDAHVVAAGPTTAAAALARPFGSRVAAVWIAATADGPAGERIAVVVTERDPAGGPR